MNTFQRYTLSTLGYALMALGGITAIFTFWKDSWILVVIGICILLVSLDNCFCADRARKAGVKAKGHYTLPFRKS